MNLIKVDNRNLGTYLNAKDNHGRNIIYGFRFVGKIHSDYYNYYQSVNEPYYVGLYNDKWNRFYFL